MLIIRNKLGNKFENKVKKSNYLSLLSKSIE